MKVVAKLAGGSHLYGLNTPESDYDERYVYLHDSIDEIIGLGKNEFIDHRNGETDSFGYEFRNFLVSLRKTNTQAMEILFAPDESFTELHPLFKEVRKNRFNLIDPKQYFNSLRGYMYGERRLANGERQGKLGGKRKEQLDKYGFSPKNFVQLFRLAECGIALFNNHEYPVNISKYNPTLHTWLMELKTNPGKFNKDELNKLVDEKDEILLKTYEFYDKYCMPGNRLHFDNNKANELIFNAYYPMLGKLHAINNGL